MRRVLVVGTTGSGKTTVARALALRLGVPHIELDELFWLRGWQSADEDSFRENVERAISAAEGWVVCGNYRPQTVDITWPLADAVVWLDLPRWVVVQRVTRRTATRIARRRDLWNGNRESLRGALSREGVLRWAWVSFARNRERYNEMRNDPSWSHLQWVQLRTPREVRRFLTSLGAR